MQDPRDRGELDALASRIMLGEHTQWLFATMVRAHPQLARQHLVTGLYPARTLCGTDQYTNYNEGAGFRCTNTPTPPTK